MSQASITALNDESAPAAGSVFQALVADIVADKYPSGTRLPPERELARQLGASRPTLREALRRMSEWGLVEARRGSGVVVRDRRHWTLEVLPPFLVNHKFGPQGPSMGRIAADMLSMRRLVLADVVGMLAERVTTEGLGRARATMYQAWERRSDAVAFAKLDFEIYRILVESAQMLPSLWLLNTIGRVYDDLAVTLGQAFVPIDDYIERVGAMLDALEAKDADVAAKALDAYFEHNDGRLMGMLGMLGA